MGLAKKIVLGIVGLTAMIGGCTAYSGCYIVHQDEQAVVKRLGKNVRVILNPINDEKILAETEEVKKAYDEEGMPYSVGPGLYFKTPFIESVQVYDRRIQRWNGAQEEVGTRDKKYLYTDPTARWYIKDPLKFGRTVGTEEQAHARMDDVVDSKTRTAINNRNLIEVVRSSNREMQVTEKELQETVSVGKITEGRQAVMAEVCDKSRAAMDQFGIGIVHDGYLIRGLTYVDSVKQAVEARMISERTRIAAKYRSEGEGQARRILGEQELQLRTIQSEAYRRAQTIRGDAEAAATKIYADGFVYETINEKTKEVVKTEKILGLNASPEFYTFLRTMELYETGMGGPGKVHMTIGTDSPLFRFLKSGYVPMKDVKPVEQPAAK
jgi:modulator of FtsH protease HflC